MKKHIKDYLHLYFNSEVIIKPWSEAFNEKLTLAPKYKRGKLIVVDHLGNCTVKTEEGNTVFSKENILLSLRPLSDMTREEDEIYQGEKRFQKATPVHQVGLNVDTPNSIKYLLDIGIDIFGLIDAGLAINKTTLKLTI